MSSAESVWHLSRSVGQSQSPDWLLTGLLSIHLEASVRVDTVLMYTMYATNQQLVLWKYWYQMSLH